METLNNLCQCGCGTAIPVFTCRGRRSRFARSHHFRTPLLTTANAAAIGPGRVEWLAGELGISQDLASRLIQKLFDKTVRTDASECWGWTGKKTNTRGGYPQLRYLHNNEMRYVAAHRLSFALRHLKWPVPLACHSCDNPPCTNHDHLFEGTNKDNAADAMRKGRLSKRKREAAA